MHSLENKTSIRIRFIYVRDARTESLITLRALMEEVCIVQEQVGNASREVDVLRIKGNSRS